MEASRRVQRAPSFERSRGSLVTYVSGLTFPLFGPFRSINDAVRVPREDARQLARLPLEPRPSTNPLSVVVRLEQRNREVATRASGLRRSLRRHQAASRCLCLAGEGGQSDSKPQRRNEGRGIVGPASVVYRLPRRVALCTEGWAYSASFRSFSICTRSIAK